MASQAVIKSSVSLWSLTSCVLGAPNKKNKSFSDNESSYASDSESETSTDDIVFETVKPKKPLKRAKTYSHSETKYAEKVEYSTISMDDFLYKQNEFRLWLREKRKPELCSRLSASKQNKYFKEFVKLWNKRKLLPKYYKPSLLTRRDTLAPVNHSQRFSFADPADSPLIPNFQPSPQVSFSSDSPQRATSLSTFGKQAAHRAGLQAVETMPNPVRKIPSTFGEEKKLLLVPAQVPVSKLETKNPKIREPKKRKTNRNEMMRKCSVCSHHPLTRQCAKKCLLISTEED